MENGAEFHREKRTPVYTIIVALYWVIAKVFFLCGLRVWRTYRGGSPVS